MLTRAGNLLFPALIGGLLLAASSPGWALDERWSVTFGLGGMLPSLGDLDDGLFQSPFTGTATVLVREGSDDGGDTDNANETEVIPFRYENNLDSVDVAVLGGVEFAWHANERHAFIFGLGTMEHTSTTVSIGNIPLQQYFVSNVVEGERRGKISFTEYMLGWRYNVLRRNHFRMYTRLSVHEVFDIDYRDDFVFLFQESPIEDLVGVRRNMIAEAQASSLFMGQIGLGGEWFLQDWLSVGVEGGYVIGEADFSLSDVRLRDDFQPGDGVNRTGMPFRQMSDGTLGYLISTATPDDLADPATRENFYRSVRLSFDSWRVLLRVSVYF